jgi:hypothetical protein
MIRLEIFTHDRHGYAGMHVAGFLHYRRQLRRRLAVESALAVYASPQDLRRRLCDSPADAAIVIADWRTPVEDLRETYEAARKSSAERKLVHFDTFDQTSTPHFGLLPVVDVFLKSKLLSPLDKYAESYAGGYIVTDHYQRVCDWDLEGWHFGSITDAACLHKIALGWNFAVSRHCRGLLRLNRLLPVRYASRSIDVHARITPPDRNAYGWYERSREFAAQTIEPLRKRYHVTPVGRVSRWSYLAELRQSKLVFSPFGWGEVCLRDYQAVCCGCVLVKPDMSHLQTNPDIFVPHVTYIPVKWDLSDLEEVCDRCLREEPCARAIAAAARKRLTSYFARERFVDDVGHLLDRLGFHPPQPQTTKRRKTGP